MYSVTPSFIRSDERHDRHKGWPAASERCHGEEVERAFSPLQKLVHLVRLHEEHDAGSQRDLLAVQDDDPEPFGHDQLVVPFVTMHRGVPALSDDQLVHRGLSGPVFATDERFHLHVWLPSSKKRIAGTDRTWLEYKRPGKPAALLRFCASRASCLVRDRVLDAYLGERVPAFAAGDAGTAVDVAVPVARPSHVEGNLHLEAHADHIVLRFPAQRYEDLDRIHIVGPEAQMEDAVQEVEELRARVWERFWIDPVVASDNISDGVELGIVASETVEDQVPTGDVPLRGIEESAVLEAFLSEGVQLFQN